MKVHNNNNDAEDEEEVDGVITISSSAEQVFCLWWLHHAGGSNGELARLSNLSRRWRWAMKGAIQLQVTGAIAAPRIESTARSGSSSSNSLQRQPTPLLLLPSMVHCRLHREQQQQQLQEQKDTHYASQAAAASTNLLLRETFCAAWFAPSGIVKERISLVKNRTSTKNDECLPTGTTTTTRSIAPIPNNETTTRMHQNPNNNNGHATNSNSLSIDTAATPFVPSGGDGQTYRGSEEEENDEIRSKGSVKQQQRQQQYHSTTINNRPTPYHHHHHHHPATTTTNVHNTAATATASQRSKSPSVANAVAATASLRTVSPPPPLPTTRPPISAVTPSDKRNDDENDGLVSTCREWRGYQTPLQVLQPFGYSAAFIHDVLALSSLSSSSSSSSPFIKEPSSLQQDSANGSCARQQAALATFAVRGAVIARPESYCFCVESHLEQLRAFLQSDSNNNTNSKSPPTNGGSAYNAIRWQEYKHSIWRKERRRLDLQRDVLPRLIVRSFPSQSRAVNLVTEGTAPEPPSVSTPSRTTVTIANQQKQNACVQFLNASGSHAVCMMTPPFACGPIHEPVTIFCVGIATEDGCFLSGLHQRFELGHLYPNDPVAEATEQSPACIATEVNMGCATESPVSSSSLRSAAGANVFAGTTTSTPTTSLDYKIIRNEEAFADYRSKTSSHVGRVEEFDDDADDRDDDGDSSCEGSEEDKTASSSCHHHNAKCSCIFRGVGEKVAALDEEKPRIIHRGRMGPGMWHCYVAVFDGEKSTIRIDGIQEPMQSDLHGIVVPECGESVEQNSRRNKAALDGLTIGSDHCFGMSLCCGNGSGGEGEGAIAELAVFQGRLDLDDIRVLENEMMTRNCIQDNFCIEVQDQSTNITGRGNSDSVWIDDEWARQAHALFFLNDLDMSSYSTMTTKQETPTGLSLLKHNSPPPPPHIPLRFLSRHRSVAWQQTNPVTGQPIHTKRIGCKPGASSSDL